MKSEIKIKGNMDPDTVVAVLEDLLTSFKDGKICIQKDKEFVTLKPGNDIEVEIEAGHKKNKQKLSVELSWRQVEPAEETAGEFKISSQEPEIKAPVPAEEEAEEAGGTSESAF